MADETVVVVPTAEAIVETQVVSVAADTDIQRARPIEAVGPPIVGSRTEAVARSGQEYAVAVGAGYAVTVNAVKCGPLPSAVVY